MAGRQNSSDGKTPKRGLVLRIFILVIAGLMLAGVVLYPFLTLM
ncbi:MAG: hypothetical protein Q4F95_01540 [Oscillospiraceae bacterium]|nr:hypothetical protein [Oscillospiraceae bacterium]